LNIVKFQALAWTICFYFSHARDCITLLSVTDVHGISLSTLK